MTNDVDGSGGKPCSTVVKWVDDYGTTCGIATIRGERRLIFKDSDGAWREVKSANNLHDKYHAYLIRKGRANGTETIVIRNQ